MQLEHKAEVLPVGCPNRSRQAAAGCRHQPVRLARLGQRVAEAIRRAVATEIPAVQASPESSSASQTPLATRTAVTAETRPTRHQLAAPHRLSQASSPCSSALIPTARRASCLCSSAFPAATQRYASLPLSLQAWTLTPFLGLGCSCAVCLAY